MLVALKTSIRAFIHRVAGLKAGFGSRNDSPAGKRHIRKSRCTIRILSRGGTRSGYRSNSAKSNSECPHSKESNFLTFLDCSTRASQGSHTPLAFPTCWDCYIPALWGPAIHGFHHFDIASKHPTIWSPSTQEVQAATS